MNPMDDAAVFLSFCAMFAALGHMYGYQSGKAAGIDHAEARHEAERKHRAEVIAQLQGDAE